MKGQKKEILTRQESQHPDSYRDRPNVFYFLPIAHFLKQLPTYIAHIAKATQVNDENQSFVKECNLANALLLSLSEFYISKI